MTRDRQDGRTMSKQFKQMTAAEARTAFYVDFEGGKDAPPVLMGILRKHTQQYVVEPVFRPLGPAYLELRQAVATVVTRAEKQARRIASWSEHDLEIVRSLTKEPELIRSLRGAIRQRACPRGSLGHAHSGHREAAHG